MPDRSGFPETVSSVNEANSKRPDGAISVGETATTTTAFPWALAWGKEVFSTIVEKLELVEIWLVNLTLDLSKLKTILTKPTLFVPESNMILTFPAGGTLMTGGEKLTETVLETGAGGVGVAEGETTMVGVSATGVRLAAPVVVGETSVGEGGT